MAHLRIHLVYLSLLGFLAYQYWTKTQALDETVGSIEQFDKIMNQDNHILSMASTMILNGIEMNAKALSNGQNLKFSAKARTVVANVWYLNKWFEQQKTEFLSLSGGLDMRDTTVLAHRFDTKTSSHFFTNSKIQQIRDSLFKLSTALKDISDTSKYSQIQRIYTIPKFLDDDKYWQSLKNKTVTESIAQLTSIQSRLELDAIPYLNYIYGEISFCGKHDDYRLVISPQKETIIEGETYKADFFIVDNLSQSNNEVTFTVNNRNIPIIGGVAHFEEANLPVGNKSIKATAIIRQPLTGVVYTSDIELEYRVFPKCSRDCK
jgi:hypothetical protein